MHAFIHRTLARTVAPFLAFCGLLGAAYIPTATVHRSVVRADRTGATVLVARLGVRP